MAVIMSDIVVAPKTQRRREASVIRTALKDFLLPLGGLTFVIGIIVLVFCSLGD